MTTMSNRQDVDTHDQVGHDHSNKRLQIFVNRRKFDEGDGVRSTMTGAQIAGLVKIPVENAVVHLETGPNKGEIAIAQTMDIENGQHFVVTRKVVEGGAHA